MPNLYIIAGCNGAGKTTASFTILPEMLNCREFVNADEIAKGLSPFQPEKVAFASGRLMLARIKELILLNQDFAFETTLSTKSYHSLIGYARNRGYTIILIFIWLKYPELAIERVASRVKNGGHFIPDEIVKRRYKRGLKNLFEIYLHDADHAIVIDNSINDPLIIARGKWDFDWEILNSDIWNSIQNY
jgi:predicted ABC-type ATPase